MVSHRTQLVRAALPKTEAYPGWVDMRERTFKEKLETRFKARDGHPQTMKDLGTMPRGSLNPRKQVSSNEVCDYRYLLSPETRKRLEER